MQYEKAADGSTHVTGLKLSKAGEEKVVQADVYVAALDVPGAKRLLPQVCGALVRCGDGCCCCPASVHACRRACKFACLQSIPARVPCLPVCMHACAHARAQPGSVITCINRTSKPEPDWDDNLDQ